MPAQFSLTLYEGHVCLELLHNFEIDSESNFYYKIRQALVFKPAMIVVTVKNGTNKCHQLNTFITLNYFFTLPDNK